MAAAVVAVAEMMAAAAVFGLVAASAATSGIAANFAVAATAMVQEASTSGAAMASAAHGDPSFPSPLRR